MLEVRRVRIKAHVGHVAHIGNESVDALPKKLQKKTVVIRTFQMEVFLDLFIQDCLFLLNHELNKGSLKAFQRELNPYTRERLKIQF